MHTKALNLLLFLFISTQIQSLKIKTSSKTKDYSLVTVSAVPTWVPADPPIFKKSFLNTVTVKDAAERFRFDMYAADVIPEQPRGNGEFELHVNSGERGVRINPSSPISSVQYYLLLGPLKLDYTGKQITVTFKPTWINKSVTFKIFEDLKVKNMVTFLMNRWKEKDKITPPFTDRKPDAYYNSKKLYGDETFAQNKIPDGATLELEFDKLKLSVIPDWIPYKTSINVTLYASTPVKSIIDILFRNDVKNTVPKRPSEDVKSYYLSFNNKKLDETKSLFENGVRMFDEIVMSNTGGKINLTIWATDLISNRGGDIKIQVYRDMNVQALMDYLVSKHNGGPLDRYQPMFMTRAGKWVKMNATFKENNLNYSVILEIVLL